MAESNLSAEEIAGFWEKFAIGGCTPKSVNDFDYLERKESRRRFYSELYRLTDGNLCMAGRALDMKPDHISQRLRAVDLKWRDLGLSHVTE